MNGKAGGDAAPARGGAGAPADPSATYLAKRTELVLREIEQLPTLSSVAARVLQLGSSDEVNVKEIVRVIETDPSLTVKLLSMCKRAATRTRVPVTTVEMAVVMLGLEAVRALVLSVEIFDWTKRLERPEDRAYDAGAGGTARGQASTRPGGVKLAPEVDQTELFTRVGFWQHSIAVACAADLITREHPHLDFRPEEAFVCGLTHDIGKLALEWVLPKAYARVVALAAHHQADIGDFEQAVVGLDHCIAGARLAERWGLPDLMRDSIALHHAVSKAAVGLGNGAAGTITASGERIAAVVAIADGLCRRLGLGWSGNHSTVVDEAALCAAVGIKPDRVQAAAAKLYELASARCKELGLGEEPTQQLLVESILRANSKLGKLNQQLVDAKSQIEDAQSQLAEARTLARLGQMTAGAAHEMNNPLAVMSGRAQALLSRVRDDKDKQACQAIVDAAQRLTGLIARLNRIASPPQPVPEESDLRQLLSESVSRAKSRLAAGAEATGVVAPIVPVKLVVPEAIAEVRLDKELISDALVEIVLNAMEAKPRTGVEIRAGADQRGQLVLDVIDDGVGMSAQALAHAMDPFFSDKPAGRQSGLGLALADRIIRLHQGEIVMNSRPGKGTTVGIRLPGALPGTRVGAARSVA